MTPARLDKPNQIYSLLKRYIDKTADFKKHNLLEVEITSDLIKSRSLDVVIPQGTTFAGWEQINRALSYARGKDVSLNITVIQK